MFVRKKPNKSGTISVQVVDKRDGYRIVKTLGASRDPLEVRRFVEMGKAFIARQDPQLSLFPEEEHQNATILDFVQTISNSAVRVAGPELIFGRLFDQIGFSAITEPLFRDIVIARLVYPTSKLKTVDYLLRYQNKQISADSIYLFLDRLKARYSKQAQQIAYEHSRSRLKQINLVFYDMTTLYFEAEDEDDLRRIGFSKEGKFQNPQIMLGLLVGENGYPLGYDIFEGNTFEGKTLLPVLQRIREAHGLEQPVVVADAAMLSTQNVNSLIQSGYSFIVAARLKNETAAQQKEILEKCRSLSDGQAVVFLRENGCRLVVTYSEKRAHRDQTNRARGIERLRKQIRTGRLTKKQLNQRGYNSVLRMKGELLVEIDEEKVARHASWDGLKGYLTNTQLAPDQIVKNYAQLWHIEKAFRISKTDLRVRPIYHRLPKRIEAHVLVAFVAYAIFKELERRLLEAGIPFSPKRATELTQTMYALRFQLPTDPESKQVFLKMSEDQQQLFDLICR